MRLSQIKSNRALPMDESQPMNSMRYTRTFKSIYATQLRCLINILCHELTPFILRSPSANLKIEDLTGYLATKEKFANEKCLKRANFKVAIDQIEAALNGDDSGPLDAPPAVRSADDDDDNNDEEGGGGGDDEADDAGDPEPPQLTDDTFTQSMIDVSMNETAANESTTATAAAAEAVAADESLAEDTGDEKPALSTPVATTSAPMRKAAAASRTKKDAPAAASAASPKKETAVAAVATAPGTTSESDTELKSRSGRKIKPKRYLHEEIEEAVTLSPAKRKASVEVTSVGQKAPQIFKVSNAKCPDTTTWCLGVFLNQKKNDPVSLVIVNIFIIDYICDLYYSYTTVK